MRVAYPLLQAAPDFTGFRSEVAKRNKKLKWFRFRGLRHLFTVEALRNGIRLYSLWRRLSTKVGAVGKTGNLQTS